MSHSWQKICCGPFSGASVSLPSRFLVWCRREHAVSLAGARSHIPRHFPSSVAQKLEKALLG